MRRGKAERQTDQRRQFFIVGIDGLEGLVDLPHRASADLVENHQASPGRLAQDLGGLPHLDHEGGLAAREAVAGSHPGEDAVDDADLRALGGKLPLRDADVGAASDEVLGHAHGDVRIDCGHRPRLAEQGAKILGRPAEQHRQRAQQHGGADQRPGLVDVEILQLCQVDVPAGETRAGLGWAQPYLGQG